MEFVESGATADGELALGEAVTGLGPGGRFVGPATLNRTTGALSVLRQFSNPLSQVVSTAGDAQWIVWVEGSNPFDFADWALYSYNRTTRQIRQLAAALKPYPSIGFLSIYISQGVVVWSATGADGLYRAYAVNADGTDFKILALNARGPQIIWPWVMYDAQAATTGAGAHMVLKNIVSSEVTDLATPTDVAYFAYDGKSIAWVTGDTNDLWLMAPIGSKPQHIYSGSHLQFVSMNSRVVGWGQNLGALAYDRKLKVVVRLSSLFEFYPVVSDGALDWLYQPDPKASDQFANTVEEMVDVADLP